MTGERRKKHRWDWRGLPERWEMGKEQNLATLLALEQLVTGSTENPDAFLEEWIQPLLRQGLSMERAYELVIESVFQPN